jgi:hypothetical protein
LGIGILTGLVIPAVTVNFFYPLRHRAAYQVSVTLICIGCACLSVTLASFGFFQWNHDTITAPWSTFDYEYLLPIILAIFISSWVSLRVVSRYVAMQYPSLMDNPQNTQQLNSYKAFIGILAGAAAAGLYQHALQDYGTLPYRWLIPQGYVGAIGIKFDQPGTPALPIESGHLLVSIPPGGLLKTSSSPEGASLLSEDYYYVAPDGTRQALAYTGETYPGSGKGGMIWEEGNYFDLKSYGFFVGTQDQYDTYVGHLRQGTTRHIGPIDLSTETP